MTIPLTENEYKETMTGKMVDVTTIAEACVDIWPYVAQLIKTNELPNYVYENQWACSFTDQHFKYFCCDHYRPEKRKYQGAL